MIDKVFHMGAPVLPLDLTDVTHHHVNKGVLYQTEEHKEGAGGHEHVDGLQNRKFLVFSTAM